MHVGIPDIPACLYGRGFKGGTVNDRPEWTLWLNAVWLWLAASNVCGIATEGAARSVVGSEAQTQDTQDSAEVFFEKGATGRSLLLISSNFPEGVLKLHFALTK